MTSENNSRELIQFDVDAALNRQSQSDKFQELLALNVNDKVENRNGFSYLCWSEAWALFKKVYPNASYRVIKDPNTNLPFFVDPQLGIIIYTEVTADFQTYEMWLPVMDSSNKSMKMTPYTYQVWDKQTRSYIDRNVPAATMFDVNKTIMRCLVKNLAMFGLGLYLYSKDALPEQLPTDEQPQAAPPTQPKRQRKAAQTPAAVDRYAGIKAAIASAANLDELINLFNQHQLEVTANPEIKALFSARKLDLLQQVA